jgi:hypothetical protein
MSGTTLIRWSGLAAILSGVLLAASTLLAYAGSDTASPSLLSSWLFFASYTLLLFGLNGILAFQVREAGVVGLLGYVLAVIGTAAFIGDHFGPADAIAQALGALGGITWGLGFILLAIASWRANMLPRWAAALLLVGVVLFEAGFGFNPALFSAVILGSVIFGLGLVGAGSGLWSAQG